MAIDIKDYTKKVVIFLDLLGIKEFISKYEKSEPKKISDLYNTILRIIEFQYPDVATLGNPDFSVDANKVVKANYLISALSDSIVITLDLQKLELLPFIIRTICLSQIIFLSKDVPIRGYITIGKCYHDKTYNMIFGGGLIEAYQYERDIVKYPRVIIDKAIVNRLRKIYGDRKGLTRVQKKYENDYPEMKGFDAFFALGTKNLNDSIGTDVLDNLYTTRLDLSEFLSRHNILSTDSLSLKEMLVHRTEYFRKQYEKTNDKKYENVLEKWRYLHDKIMPTLESIEQRIVARDFQNFLATKNPVTTE